MTCRWSGLLAIVYFFPRVSTLSPLCNSCFRICFPEIIYFDSHFDMFSRSLCFLLFLDLFISCSFVSFMFKGVFSFHFFICFHVFSFPAFFSLEKPITNPDHWHVDPLSFAHLTTCPYRLLMSRPLPAQHAMLAGRQLRWKLHCHRHRGRDVQAVRSTAAGDGGDFEEVGSTAGVIITWDFSGLFGFASNGLP